MSVGYIRIPVKRMLLGHSPFLARDDPMIVFPEGQSSMALARGVSLQIVRLPPQQDSGRATRTGAISAELSVARLNFLKLVTRAGWADARRCSSALGILTSRGTITAQEVVCAQSRSSQRRSLRTFILASDPRNDLRYFLQPFGRSLTCCSHHLCGSNWFHSHLGGDKETSYESALADDDPGSSVRARSGGQTSH